MSQWLSDFASLATALSFISSGGIFVATRIFVTRKDHNELVEQFRIAQTDLSWIRTELENRLK